VHKKSRTTSLQGCYAEIVLVMVLRAGERTFWRNTKTNKKGTKFFRFGIANKHSEVFTLDIVPVP
jgi:hypothetical protein